MAGLEDGCGDSTPCFFVAYGIFYGFGKSSYGIAMNFGNPMKTMHFFVAMNFVLFYGFFCCKKPGSDILNKFFDWSCQN